MANNVLVQHVFIMPDETAARQGKKLRALFDACASDSLESPLAQVADKLGVSLDGIDARTFEVEFVEPGDKPDLMSHARNDYSLTCLLAEEDAANHPKVAAWDKILAKFPRIQHFWMAQDPCNDYFEKSDRPSEGIFPSIVVNFYDDDNGWVTISDYDEESVLSRLEEYFPDISDTEDWANDVRISVHLL